KEGQNIVLEYRLSESEQIPKVAAELVRTQVDVIVMSATAIHRARQATATTPVVFVIADDPVAAGFVVSLARPGGRMTGLTSLNVELDAKRLEILKTALPMWRSSASCQPHAIRRVETASRSLNRVPAPLACTSRSSRYQALIGSLACSIKPA